MLSNIFYDAKAHIKGGKIYPKIDGTVTFKETIGSKRTGEASINPLLKAILDAVLNAISEESTGW